MALSVDTSRQLRSINELADLVRAIFIAEPTESEPDWLEWKREAVLGDRRWHAIIAKCIAGFANRDPIVATQQAGGCAYMVLGAEPANVGGIVPVDNATLQAGISRFVGETVRWSPHYVQHAGQQVLVITVEPPEYGDPIVAMQRSYQGQQRGASVCREGDVFIRRHGSTDLARQSDYDMLVRRFGEGAVRANGISVEALDTVTATPFAADAVDVHAWWDRQEQALLEPLGASGVTTTLSPIFEWRTPDEYRSEVESYLSAMVSLFPSIARSLALKDRAPGMHLLLVNETEQNFAAARVEVSIEGDVWAYRAPEDAQPEMPQKPRGWGTRTRLGLFAPPAPSMPKLDMFGPHIDNSGSAIIKFDDVDLRPGERVELPSIHLVADAQLAGSTLTAKWTATSSNASGVAHGDFPIKVSDQIVSLRLK